MIITRTPYRVSLFGGGTDYRPWFEKKGGLVVVTAIEHYCYISLRELPPFFDHKSRVVYSNVEEVNNHSDIKHRAVRACITHHNIEYGVEVHHDGDLPARTGIGSSSSFTVGFLQAIYTLKSQMRSRRELADEAIFMEQEVMGENVGIQDQIIASHGGFLIIEMGPGNHYSIQPMILPDDYKKKFESHVLLAFSGFSRYATEYAKTQVDNIVSGRNDSYLEEMYDIAKSSVDLFRNQEDFQKIGKLMDENWKLKRSLADNLSNNGIDNIYEKAKKAGAWGGKLLGAGGGGFIMFFAPPEKHDKIKDALSELKVWVPYSIDESGSQILLNH